LTLQPKTEFKIVGEAVDGMDALQKARDLQPDLVLMDIGLPKLNGFAAAEQIRSLVPQAKLLFLTLESSPAAVHQAFNLGGLGYVHKMWAQYDLVPAIEAVLGDKRFVSREMDCNGARPYRRHDVQFYSDEMVFLDSSTRFVEKALKANEAAIVLLTQSHAAALAQRLKADGIDLDTAIKRGTYVSLDAAEALTNISVNGQIDCDRFSAILISLIETAAKATNHKHPHISIFGECVALLCAQGNAEAALQIERKGNEILQKYDIEIMCAYPQSAREGEANGQVFKSICAEHSAVFSR
jgi:CheY-like chemotaxis protein